MSETRTPYCSRCGGLRTNRGAYCKPCAAAYCRERRAKRTPAQREADIASSRTRHARRGALLNRQRLYGLSEEQQLEMIGRQSGECAGCGETPEQWCVDHDHETGRVRAMLCNRCNLTLGHSGDDPALLRKLAVYLDAYAALEGE